MNKEQSFDEVLGKLTFARKTLKATKSALRDTNQQIHYTGQYLANTKVYGQMLKAKNKGNIKKQWKMCCESYIESKLINFDISTTIALIAIPAIHN